MQFPGITIFTIGVVRNKRGGLETNPPLSEIEREASVNPRSERGFLLKNETDFSAEFRQLTYCGGRSERIRNKVGAKSRRVLLSPVLIG